MSDIGKMGYEKVELGSDHESDHMLESAFVGKQVVASKIHEIAKHLVVSQFYSGAPGEGQEAKDHSASEEKKEQAEYLK